MVSSLRVENPTSLGHKVNKLLPIIMIRMSNWVIVIYAWAILSYRTMPTFACRVLVYLRGTCVLQIQAVMADCHAWLTVI